MRSRVVICSVVIAGVATAMLFVACSPSGSSVDGGQDSSPGGDGAGGEAGTGYILASGSDSCVINPAGDLYCWGFNTCGEVGVDPDLDTVPCTIARGTSAGHCHPQPTRVAGIPPVKQVSTSGSDTCAVDVSGAVWCWGRNLSGALGHPVGFYGDKNYTSCSLANATPVQVPNVVATSVVVSSTNGCAVTTAGGVMCWGDNSLGQIGQPPGGNVMPPTAINNLSNVQSVAIDEFGTHVCALKTDETVWCWGLNDVWQLGFGADASATPNCASSANRYCFETPTRVPFSDEAVDSGTSNVRSIAMPNNAACVVRGPNGDLWCWGPPPDYLGAANYSWVGIPDAAPSFPPKQVNGVTQLASVNGQSSVCVLGTSGSVSCWGLSDCGELGNGVLDGGTKCNCIGNCGTGNYCTAAPVQVPVTMRSIATGSALTIGVAPDGGLVGWGNNTAGSTGHPPGTNGDVQSCTLSPTPFTFSIP